MKYKVGDIVISNYCGEYIRITGSTNYDYVVVYLKDDYTLRCNHNSFNKNTILALELQILLYCP